MPQLKPTRGICLNRSHPLSRGLVGFWPFNEGSGNKVFDLSGNNNTGSVNGTPDWIPGKFGSGLHYNGSSQYTDIGSSPSYKNDEKGTIIVWFSLDALFDADSVNQKLYGFGGGDFAGTDGLFGFELRRRDSVAPGKTRIGFFQANDGYSWPDDVSGFMGSTDLVANTQYQAALVSNGSSWKIYLNSIEESLTSWGGDANNGDWFGDTSLTAQLSHLIAARTLGGTIGGYFDGKIDHVILYNRALAAPEITLLYRKPFCMFEQAMRPKLIGGQIVNLGGSSVALSSLSATSKAMRKVGGNVISTTNVAAILNLIRSLLYIESNWKREALFNGMTANAFKLGTTLSFGWFWVRVAGCSVLYRGSSMVEIDFVNILAVAEQDACKISPPSYISHNSGSTYFYVVRRFNNCGYQECTLAASVKISIKSNGELAQPQPNKVFDSAAELVDGNKIQLVWYYCPLEQKSQPDCFNVYYDDRTGQIDYQTPLATIDYKGRKFYSYQFGALEAGRYLFAIRTEEASGIENSSLARLRIQFDPTNPETIDILSAEGV